MKKSSYNKEVRKAVYRRDGFQCAVCGDPRRLQIHHIIHRSQGGGEEQMNMVTLCATCHALAHGMNLVGVDLTPEDVNQTVVEYMSDLYADLGFRWPDGEPLEKMPATWADALDEFYFSAVNPVEEIADMIDGITAKYGRGSDD